MEVVADGAHVREELRGARKVACARSADECRHREAKAVRVIHRGEAFHTTARQHEQRNC